MNEIYNTGLTSMSVAAAGASAEPTSRTIIDAKLIGFDNGMFEVKLTFGNMVDKNKAIQSLGRDLQIKVVHLPQEGLNNCASIELTISATEVVAVKNALKDKFQLNFHKIKVRFKNSKCYRWMMFNNKAERELALAILRGEKDISRLFLTPSCVKTDEDLNNFLKKETTYDLKEIISDLNVDCLLPTIITSQEDAENLSKVFKEYFEIDIDRLSPFFIQHNLLEPPRVRSQAPSFSLHPPVLLEELAKTAPSAPDSVTNSDDSDAKADEFLPLEIPQNPQNHVQRVLVTLKVVPYALISGVCTGMMNLLYFIKNSTVQQPKPVYSEDDPYGWFRPKSEFDPPFDEKSATFTKSDEGVWKLRKRIKVIRNSEGCRVYIKKYLRHQQSSDARGGTGGTTAKVSQDEINFKLDYPYPVEVVIGSDDCFFHIEKNVGGKPEIIRVTSGFVKDKDGNKRVAFQLTNLSCRSANQLIWDSMTEDQIKSAVKDSLRKPVIYYYGYDTNTTISTAVTLDPRLSFYELIPGFNHVVNINKAPWMELSRLPGIGTQLAKRMVASRPKGGYLQVTDILEIKGIGAKTFDGIQPFIGVDDTPNHWVVNQSPKNDGSVIDIKDNNAKYPYLFWEANAPHGVFTFNVDQSFCVKKDVLTSFLTEKLAVLGLNKKESADFIEFWVPLLTGDSFKMYPYVMVEFMEENYTDLAALAIHPQPDQVIRVFAHFQLSAEPITCGEPELTPVTRMDHGRVVVEWGGTEGVPDSMPTVGTSVKAPHYAMQTG